MINETSLEISDEYKRWQVELEGRYARRSKVRHIDSLLNHLEVLNLTESHSMPVPFRRQVRKFLDESEHSLSRRPERDLTIAHVMEALYDIQDTLLLGGDDEEDGT